MEKPGVLLLAELKMFPSGLNIFLRGVMSKILDARELGKFSKELKLLLFFSFGNKSRQAFQKDVVSDREPVSFFLFFYITVSPQKQITHFLKTFSSRQATLYPNHQLSGKAFTMRAFEALGYPSRSVSNGIHS